MESRDLPPVQQLPLKDTVYERILRAITCGTLPPGMHVTVRQLAEKLEVGVMPVREAIRKLEADGLIAKQKNRRIMISRFSLQELSEVLQIRLTLEPMAARKAAKKRTEETIKGLEHLMGEMQHATDIEEYYEKNRDFHYTIYRTADMPILFQLIQDLWMKVSPYLHICLAEDTDHKTTAIDSHQGMLRGMIESNPKEVCKWLRVDLKRAAKMIIEVLERREISDRES